MNNWDKVEAAFDLLESAEIMHEFEDSLWIKIDRELWQKLHDSDNAEGE